MRGLTSTLAGVLVLFTVLAARPSFAAADMKEWTFMVFLNGNNNLDSYGAININQLETVGSTKDVNLVVQWASAATDKTKRLLVTKDNDTTKVTSPILEEMPRVDMGDWKNLVEFVRWTVQRYPAKHYFISLWNHGSGWHRNARLPLVFRDINFDDFSGNSMSTEQLGLAMEESAQIIGHRVDILGMDACLMAMVEVNDEFADTVDVALASEDLEPGLGWPYDKIVERWTAKPTATSKEIARIFTEEYLKLYLPGGAGAGLGDVTLSSMDLRQSERLDAALTELSDEVKKLGTADVEKAKQVASEAQRFGSDYVDVGDYVAQLKAANVGDRAALDSVTDTLKAYVNSNHVSPKFKGATGASFWLPSTKAQYDRYAKKYKALQFSRNTGWDSALEWLLK